MTHFFGRRVGLIPIQSKLAAFGGRFGATESLWCIGSKICWANMLSGKTLYRTINTGKTRGAISFLVTGLKFDFQEFVRWTDIPERVLRDGTGLSLTADTALLIHIAFRHLRFCPECLAEGFHSILFQFPFFCHCPVHEVPLLDNCPQCHGLIDYKWPEGRNSAFTCPCCRKALWRPDGRIRMVPHDRYRDLSEWIAKWIHRTVAFEKSAAGICRWAHAQTGEKWSAQGLPELDGIFTPRSLMSGRYWGGREVVQPNSKSPSLGEIYRGVCRRILSSMSQSDSVDEWTRDWLRRNAIKQATDLKGTAFIAWRAFWESAPTCSDLTKVRPNAVRVETIEWIFNTNFGDLIMPECLARGAQEDIAQIAVREVLLATFVDAVRILAQGGSPNIRRKVQLHIPEAPLPLIFASRVEKGIVIEWIHQREIAGLGKYLLGPSCRLP